MKTSSIHSVEFEFVRATEAAALAAGRWMGLGRPDEADMAAAGRLFEMHLRADVGGPRQAGGGEKRVVVLRLAQRVHRRPDEAGIDAAGHQPLVAQQFLQELRMAHAQVGLLPVDAGIAAAAGAEAGDHDFGLLGGRSGGGAPGAHRAADCRLPDG